MSVTERTWPAEELDAISIWMPAADVTIEGCDEQRVTLQGDLVENYPRIDELAPVDRWLLIHGPHQHASESSFTLRLPKNKAWTVELSAWSGEAHVSGIEGRVQITLRQGDIRVENCRGFFTLSSGEGDVEIERCTEAAPPQPPPVPRDHQHWEGFAAGHDRARPDVLRAWAHWGAEDWRAWARWGAEDWRAWGMEIGKQARAWGPDVTLPLDETDKPQTSGIAVQTGSGDAHLQEIDARACTVRAGKGDVTLEGGCIASLSVHARHGDIECQSVMPEGVWAIRTDHGDIHLSLPSNAQARLDAATRHGDIESEISLVRVGRPGPEARHGRRMVGALGQTDGATAQIGVVAMNGDIEIDVAHEPGRCSRKPTAESAPQETSSRVSDCGAGSAAPATPAAGANSAVTVADEQDRNSATARDEPVYKTQLAVLQALSDGHISAQEAEQLLLSLEA